MRHSYYQIEARNRPTPRIEIFDVIGRDGVSAAGFIQSLRNLQSDRVELYIDSPGGSVFDGIAIYNALRASGLTVHGTVSGIAASIASVILMGCDTITMPENTHLMVHGPSAGIQGTAADMRAMAALLDKVNTNLVQSYMQRSGRSEDEIRTMLKQDTWLSAAQAKEIGFCDVIAPAVTLRASYDTSDLPEGIQAALKPPRDMRELANAVWARRAAIPCRRA